MNTYVSITVPSAVTYTFSDDHYSSFLAREGTSRFPFESGDTHPGSRSRHYGNEWDDGQVVLRATETRGEGRHGKAELSVSELRNAVSHKKVGETATLLCWFDPDE